MIKEPVKIILLTGFLGTGKTTVLNSLLTAYPGAGVLVNDFGEMVVDADVIRRENRDSSLKVYEIANGSIFCSCLKSAFILGLRYFTGIHPEYLFIEASGMSDPAGFTAMLEDHGLGDDFTVETILALVDPARYLKLAQVLEVVPRQIRAAGRVLVNKCDTVTDSERQAVIEAVGALNPDAVIHTGTYGTFDPPLELHSPAYLGTGRLESCNTPSNRPEAMLFDAADIDRSALDRFLEAVRPYILRLKGYYTSESRFYYLDDNAAGYTHREISPPLPRPAITIITQPRYSETVRRLWAEKIQTGLSLNTSGVES